jgi:hypothetical protein
MYVVGLLPACIPMDPEPGCIFHCVGQQNIGRFDKLLSRVGGNVASECPKDVEDGRGMLRVEEDLCCCYRTGPSPGVF